MSYPAAITRSHDLRMRRQAATRTQASCAVACAAMLSMTFMAAAPGAAEAASASSANSSSSVVTQWGTVSEPALPATVCQPVAAELAPVNGSIDSLDADAALPAGYGPYPGHH
jgi:hypothetical protein